MPFSVPDTFAFSPDTFAFSRNTTTKRLDDRLNHLGPGVLNLPDKLPVARVHLPANDQHQICQTPPIFRSILHCGAPSLSHRIG